MTTYQIITVTVNDLDPFGQGVARRNGKMLFIPELLPQESVEVAIAKNKRQFAHAQVKRRLNDNPQREVPRCPYFGVCGGYQQRYTSISLQQRSKSAALLRLVKCEASDVLVNTPWGYRRHACLSLGYRPREQRLRTGLRKSGSSDIIGIKQCLILVPQLEALLPHLRTYPESLQGLCHLDHVELVQARSGALMILCHIAPLNAANKEKPECFSHSQGLSLSLIP